MKFAVAISILGLIFFYGCAKDDTGEDIAEIGIDFVWDPEHIDRSPEVHLKNVPEGVDHIEINYYCDEMHDPHRERGGGSLPYDDSGIIPAGAFNSFSAPRSNMMGILLKIRASVKAFSKDGQLVGKGTITKKPPNR